MEGGAAAGAGGRGGPGRTRDLEPHVFALLLKEMVRTEYSPNPAEVATLRECAWDVVKRNGLGALVGGGFAFGVARQVMEVALGAGRAALPLRRFGAVATGLYGAYYVGYHSGKTACGPCLAKLVALDSPLGAEAAAILGRYNAAHPMLAGRQRESLNAEEGGLLSPAAQRAASGSGRTRDEIRQRVSEEYLKAHTAAAKGGAKGAGAAPAEGAGADGEVGFLNVAGLLGAGGSGFGEGAPREPPPALHDRDERRRRRIEEIRRRRERAGG